MKQLLLSKALVLTTNAFDSKTDQCGKPYILHCLAVMGLLNTDDEELQVIALCHDLLEDTKITIQELRDIGCTERVINGIVCMTRFLGQSEEEYQLQVMSNIDSIRVKIADLTHNSDIRRLKGVREKDIQRMVKYHNFYLKLTAKLKELECKCEGENHE